MTISVEDDAVASDFINESERDGTKANDDGRVPKLESDGYLSPSFVRDVSARLKMTGDYSLVDNNINAIVQFAEETFDTHAMTSISGDILEFDQNIAGGDNLSTTVNTKWWAQEFTTGANPFVLTKALIKWASGSGSQVSMRGQIRATLGGAALVESDKDMTTTDTSGSTQKSVHFPPYKLEANTTYFFVFKTVDVNGTSIIWLHDDDSTGGYESTDSGANFASTGGGFNIVVVSNDATRFKIPQTGKYLVIANIAGGNDVDKDIAIWKNNTRVAIFTVNAGSSIPIGEAFSTLLELTAGDMLSLTVACGTAGTAILAHSTFELIRLR